jgi:hypothetical protein
MKMCSGVSAILLSMVALASYAADAADSSLPPLRAGAAEYAVRTATAGAERCSGLEKLALPLALTENARPETRFDAASGRLHIFYPMQFNDLTEGWNWHPLAPAAGDDYYTYKYLPLGSTAEERGSYPVDEISGAHKEYPVRWRHDYFFAFDNPYAFYPRGTDDATGFAAAIEVTPAEATRLAAGDLRMALRGKLRADCLSDSTTFWKATLSEPVDFTLKKHYLIGKLEEIIFYDQASGKALARLVGH